MECAPKVHRVGSKPSPPQSAPCAGSVLQACAGLRGALDSAVHDGLFRREVLYISNMRLKTQALRLCGCAMGAGKEGGI